MKKFKRAVDVPNKSSVKSNYQNTNNNQLTQNTQTYQTNQTNHTKTSGDKDSSSIKAFDPTKNTANIANKKIKDYNNKLENVEIQIKVEQKNKVHIEDHFEAKMNSLENKIDKSEKELEKIMSDLNIKESKIFEIQKQKLESFKQEIIKMETIYNEITERLEELLVTIDSIKEEEGLSYNNTFMIYEDYLSYYNELEMLKEKMKNLKDILISIEKNKQKEFELL